MRVCFVSHGSGSGGAHLSLLDTMRFARDEGIEPYLVTNEDGPLVRKARAEGIPVSVIPYSTWVEKPYLPFGKKWRGRAYKTALAVALSPVVAYHAWRWGADAIYTNTSTICVGAMAAMLLRKPHIWHVREFGWKDWGTRYILHWRIVWWFMRHCQRMITNSLAVRDHYALAIPEEKIGVVYNYVAPPPQNVVPKSPGNGVLECVIVGTVHPAKGQHDATRAVQFLNKKGIPVRLTMVGDADAWYLYHCRMGVQHWDGMDKVRFVGWQEYPAQWRYIQEADVVLVCSKCEAFGRATVEGMLAGKPIIATGTGGTPELVRDGYEGYLYAPGDWRDLMGLIEILYRFPQERARLAANARERGRAFTDGKGYGSSIAREVRIACSA